MKIIIVGGVAGGASAATRLRRLSEDAQIIMFERGPDVSFANCGMPYHIGNEIPDRNKLLVVTPERLKERFNLDVRVHTEITQIDPQAKKVTARNVLTGETSTESYDKLILATGAAPFRPQIEGIDHPRIHTLRNLVDMDRIKKTIDSGTKNAVVIGAGFIGLELIENFLHRGLDVSLVEFQNQVLPIFDPEITTPVLESLLKKGVHVHLCDAAEKFTPTEKGVAVQLKSGKIIETELVVLGVGVRPENHLAIQAGLEVGPRGGVRVNRHMQTSHPDIYAVGDVVEVFDLVLSQNKQVPLAGIANRQGRLAADHIFGRTSSFRGAQGTAIVGFFDQVLALTGATEKALKDRQEYRTVTIHPNNHASYYPGAEAMTLKLTFDPKTGKILGAQGVGGQGVDKRIDVLSVAIQAGMTVYDLEEMELCYAPQFGSAKDPINMLGFVAAGMLRGDHPQMDFVTWHELPPEQRGVLLDVRTRAEFDQGHIPNSLHIPIDELRDRLHELPKGQRIAVYCQVGQRGYNATRILNQRGFNAFNLSGGYRSYLQLKKYLK